MKKSFLMGLVLLLCLQSVFGFNNNADNAELKQLEVQNEEVQKEELHFVLTTDDGFILDYTEYYKSGKFTGKVVLNSIIYDEHHYEINKECSFENPGITYPKNYVLSGKSVNNLKWENDSAWVVNFTDCFENPIMLGYDTLARIAFGSCNCNINNKNEKIFVIDTKLYLGNENGGGIGGTSYLARKRNKLIIKD